MRIERLTLPAFGTLREFDTGPGELGSLVVVHGANESGKSTFFEAITTVLFGFSPASRDRHPYAPWGGTDAQVEALLTLDGGESMIVQRTLLKSAKGLVTSGGTEEAIRNRPLAAVESVPRDLFRQVFALTLDELAALTTESWDQLQERLLSHMGARDVVAARSAAEKLEDEASKLWRPTRRGHQRIDDLKEEIRELMAARRDAAANDRRVRELHRSGDQLQEELREVRNEREETRVIVERATVLLPLQRRLERLTTLEESAQSGPPLDDVPDNAPGTIARLDEELADLQSRARAHIEERAEPEETVRHFTPPLQQALESRAEIAHAADLAAQADSTQLQNAQLEQSLSDLNRRISAAARELFTEGLNEDATRKLQELAIGEFRSRVDSWLDAKRSAEAADRQQQAASDHHVAPWEPLAGAAALAASAGLLWLGRAGGAGEFGAPGEVGGAGGAAGWMAPLGGILLAVGAVLIGRWYSARKRAKKHESDRAPGDSRVTHQVNREKAHARVREILEGLPVRERELDREFVAQVARLQELGEDRRARQQSLDEGTARVQAASRTVADLGERLGLDLPAQVGTAAHQLERHLTGAERAEAAALRATRELEKIEATLAGVKEKTNKITSEREALQEVLSRFGNGDPGEGARVLAERQQAAGDAARLHAEIRREHPDLEEQVARIAAAEESGEGWLVDDRALAAARASLEEFSEKIEQMVASAEGITAELVHRQDDITADRIDGEVAALREELDETKRERDRKIILAQIMRRADREFREKNDPDVIDRAGLHLAAITHGRYTELVAPDADPSASLRVIDPDYGSEVEVKQLSTGAREQVYFSLRLAIMDRLDGDDERLPVLVDEAFVNWDPERRGRVMDVLKRLSEARQVFVFTCHPEWAEELCARGGQLISLDDALEKGGGVP